MIQHVVFRQYKLPGGAFGTRWIARPAAILELAERFQAEGGRFEAEILSTGEVSLTAEWDDDYGETHTIAIEVVPNGPDVPLAVDRLVERAAASL